ncbi:hypothetical protein BROUX41_003898 [Berkeleyomyces rouxiae]|uniref:uncharacterized protein n=1 Tax=Berkeleyomyces rouxiae TaxID=2035830 RepID=UPI003B7813EC
MPKRKAEAVGSAATNAAAAFGDADLTPEQALIRLSEFKKSESRKETEASAVAPPPAKRSRRLASTPKEAPPADDSSDEEYESDASDSSQDSSNELPFAAKSTAPASKPRPKNQICTWPGCTKRYNRPTRLEGHMRSHTGERPFACTVPGCGKTYLEAKHLAQHVEGKHEGKRDHKCPYPECGRAFFTSTRLSRHVNSHIKAQQFQCKGYADCRQVFRRRDTLNRHVRQAHLGLPGYTCPETDCSEAFASSGALRNHRRRMHGELKHFCDECKVTDDDGQTRSLGFTTISELRAHFKTAHMTCSFCPYRCRYPSEMDRHVAMHHSAQTVVDRKTIACDWPGCDKKFTKRSNLNVHIKSSHNGYRFVCGLVDLSTSEGLGDWDNANGCREGFVTKANLESHVRHVHLGLQRVQTVTGRARSLVDELAGADDSQKRTLQCDCGRSFIRYHDLQVHVELDHGHGQMTQGTGQASGFGGPQVSQAPPNLSLDMQFIPDMNTATGSYGASHGLDQFQQVDGSYIPVGSTSLANSEVYSQTLNSASSPASAAGMPMLPFSTQQGGLGIHPAFVSPALTPQSQQQFSGSQPSEIGIDYTTQPFQSLPYAPAEPTATDAEMSMPLDMSHVIDSSLSTVYNPGLSAVPAAETTEAAAV